MIPVRRKWPRKASDSKPPDSSASDRALLDQLLTDSRLYHKSAQFRDLLTFVTRLRSFAPFNAMLLHIQKPGLSYAATAEDWKARFDRTIKPDSRPLLILWPFGPVSLVYDVLDTVGPELPQAVETFFARGPINAERLTLCLKAVERKSIYCDFIDAGDFKAGSIRLLRRSEIPTDYSQYLIKLNRNHEPATQFATLTHELAHLFLGHLGLDLKLKIAESRSSTHTQHELEAESVAYLVCARNGVENASETYLAKYVDSNTTVETLDLYRIMHAAGQIEHVLGLK